MRLRGCALAAVLLAVFFIGTARVSAAGVLKEGMQGSSVSALQTDLKKLGYFNTQVTGYYGSVTSGAVRKLQGKYGYAQDGMAGGDTRALIDRLLGRSAGSGSNALKMGAEGSTVLKLQQDLKGLGYLKANATGYYGDLTSSAVKNLQKQYGYAQDGIAGPKTLSLVTQLAGGGGAVSSRAPYKGKFLLSWFSEVSKIFARGMTATVYDIDTGLSFNVKRTYGTNHADCETLTAADTNTMKKIYGGSWSWNRRAVIVTVGEYKIAASIAGMPHAGSESSPANRYISSRSGGYGRGINYDAVKGNGMSGHFDMHFLGSKTHDSNRVNAAHQNMVKKAAQWAEKNLR